jgi:hypothetical protein
MTIKTNDLKKGARVILNNGWVAELADNRRGSIRTCIVYGFYTETGSVYAWDMNRLEDNSHLIELTPAQIKDRNVITAYCR